MFRWAPEEFVKNLFPKENWKFVARRAEMKLWDCSLFIEILICIDVNRGRVEVNDESV